LSNVLPIFQDLCGWACLYLIGAEDAGSQDPKVDVEQVGGAIDVEFDRPISINVIKSIHFGTFDMIKSIKTSATCFL